MRKALKKGRSRAQRGQFRQEFLDAGLQRSEPGKHLSDERQECLFPQLSEFCERRHGTDL